MKVLLVGAGSMGRRRLRDLLALEVGDVILYEPQAERCRETAAKFGVRGFTDLEQSLAENPEVIIISCPPALHGLYVQKAMECKMHIFSEVPFVFELEALEAIAAQAEKYPRVLGISHTIRYYPPFRIIHDLIRSGKIGKPLYLEYSLGNYLPDWHPYEDYRKFYASDMTLGGAGMDMLLHELGAIQWWLGKVESVYARFSKLSALEIKGPDNHDILLSFEGGGRGFFHHDMIEQGTVGRHIRIVGDLGTIEWHQNLAEVRFFDGTSNNTQYLPFSEAADWAEALEASVKMSQILAKTATSSGRIPSAESQLEYNYESNYLRELRHFLDAVCGKSRFTMSSVAEELQIVRTFHAILRSAEQGREVCISDLVSRESNR